MTDREPREINRRLMHIKNKPLLYWVSLPLPENTTFKEAEEAADTLGLRVRQNKTFDQWIDVYPKKSEE